MDPDRVFVTSDKQVRVTWMELNIFFVSSNYPPPPPPPHATHPSQSLSGGRCTSQNTHISGYTCAKLPWRRGYRGIYVNLVYIWEEVGVNYQLKIPLAVILRWLVYQSSALTPH